MMSGTRDQWAEEDGESSATLGHLLERINQDFRPTHQYQPGFVPASGPDPWSAVGTSNMAPLDPQNNVGSHLRNHLSRGTSQNYSPNQEMFADVNGVRSPLMRSSSDLGIRLGPYPGHGYNERPLDGILDSSLDSLEGNVDIKADSNVYFTDNSHHTSSTTTTTTPPTAQGIRNIQSPQYSLYSENLLSHFAASLGNLFPRDTFSNAMTNSPVSSLHAASSAASNISNYSGDMKNMNAFQSASVNPPAKPSYSDVLSKNASPPVFDKHMSGYNSRPVGSSTPSSSSSGINGRGNFSNYNKSKNRNVGTMSGNFINSSNMNSSGKYTAKSESRVGLDAFEPLPTSQCNGIMGRKNLSNFEEKCGLNESPSHSSRRNSIRSDKKEKLDGNAKINLNQESEKGQLNNRVSCSNNKNQPKKATFINNNLSTSSTESLSSTSSFNNNNFLNQKNDLKSKTMNWSKEDKKNNSFDDSSYSGVNNCQYDGRGNNYSNISGRSARMSKSPRDRPNRDKKSSQRKRKNEPLTYAELMIAVWTILIKWAGVIYNAALWVVTLAVEVCVLSFRLSIEVAQKVWFASSNYMSIVKAFCIQQFGKFSSKFTKHKNNGKKSSPGKTNDKKQNNGLECNLSLPTTGEEAMKRLLACRGKDPYSILGVSRGCTDEDIKRYYKRQAFLVHPDKNKQAGAEEAFKILAHAFEIIGEPERRGEYDARVTRMEEEAQMEGRWGELTSLLEKLREKLEEAANTIRCTNCNRRHKRLKVDRPTYAARHCCECQIKHAAREGDIWAESRFFGLRWKYYACMEGAVYDISEWAACQYENLKHLQANTHGVQYRIVSGKRSTPNKPSPSDIFSSEEEFFNNLCRERFGQDYMSGGNGHQESRKRKGKKKK